MHTSLKLQMLSAAAALAIGGGVAQADYAAYSAAVLADSPLAYYQLAGTSGTVANQAGAGVGDATYFADTSPSTEWIDFSQAGPFTGSTAVKVNDGVSRSNKKDFGYLDVDAGSTTWTNNYSAELWFRLQLPFTDSDNDGTYDPAAQYLFTRSSVTGSGSATTGSPELGDAFGIIGQGTPGRLYVNTSNGTVKNSLNEATNPEVIITAGNWYHAVLTRDGDVLTLYINELKADGTAGLSEKLTIEQAIGSYADSSNDPHPHAAFGARRDHYSALSFTGDIAEVAIYNGALSEADVMAHFGAVIPEPGSLLLLGAGATMMLYRRRTVS